ncbi:Porphobilinogen deaminase [compost metagenome]
MRAERSFLGALNGGCQIPIGAYATLLEPLDEHGAGGIELTGIVGLPDGSLMLKETLQGNDPEQLGIQLADALKARGAERILVEFGG